MPKSESTALDSPWWSLGEFNDRCPSLANQMDAAKANSQSKRQNLLPDFQSSERIGLPMMTIPRVSPTFILADVPYSKFNSPMKSSELFGVYVRVAGLLIALFGLWELWGGLENMVENLFPSEGGDQTSTFSLFADGIPALVVGTLMFFLADWVVRLAYRNPAP